MKRQSVTSAISLIIVIVSMTLSSMAQVAMKPQSITIKLTGTSTLHDWQMVATKGTTEAVFVISGDKLTSISKLNFSLPVKNLKSESNALDKNAYKAMKTDVNPNIYFVLSAASISPTGGNSYNIKAVGKITISGNTRDTELQATGTYNPADKSLTIAGIKSMKMTDFNVKPPTVMLGTIKTGNDIKIAYNLKYTK